MNDHSPAYASPTERVKTWLDGAALHVRFNNPARHNALSVDMWEAVPPLLDLLKSLDPRTIESLQEARKVLDRFRIVAQGVEKVTEIGFGFADLNLFRPRHVFRYLPAAIRIANGSHVRLPPRS